MPRQVIQNLLSIHVSSSLETAWPETLFLHTLSQVNVQQSAYHISADWLTDVHQIMMILHQTVDVTSDDQHQEKNGDLFWNRWVNVLLKFLKRSVVPTWPRDLLIKLHVRLGSPEYQCSSILKYEKWFNKVNEYAIWTFEYKIYDAWNEEI